MRREGAGNYRSGATVEINATVKTGYTWSKWTKTSGGEQVSTTKGYSAAISANWAYTANATANELTFNGATLATGTYGTAYTSGAFAAASNGSGNYKYEIVSGAPTGASIDGTNGANRKIKFTATTPAGTYNVVVKASDTTTGKTKEATFVVVINKQTVNPPTNVQVGTDGKVTWTASSNATGYEISMSSNSGFTSATSGVNLLNDITASAGTKTIYVRAVNSDTANYATPSTNASKAVTVYSVTLTTGTGISSVE